MNILKTLRNRMRAGDRDGDSRDPSGADAGRQLTDRWERLGERQAVEQLRDLSQVEMAAIETFERSHRDRASVLNKLRYLRSSEPLAGYDALEPDAIARALSGAEKTTVKAVREYERKHQRRPEVLAEVTHALHRFSEQPLVVENGLPASNGLPAK